MFIGVVDANAHIFTCLLERWMPSRPVWNEFAIFVKLNLAARSSTPPDKMTPFTVTYDWCADVVRERRENNTKAAQFHSIVTRIHESWKFIPIRSIFIWFLSNLAFGNHTLYRNTLKVIQIRLWHCFRSNLWLLPNIDSNAWKCIFR